jgi:hypothetical protein
MNTTGDGRISSVDILCVKVQAAVTSKAAKMKTLETKAAGIRKRGERVVVHSLPPPHAAIPPCIFAWQPSWSSWQVEVTECNSAADGDGAS